MTDNGQTSSELSPERLAHKQAGEKYFEEVLKKVQAGQDPFQPRQLTEATSKSLAPSTNLTKKPPRQKKDIENPDVEALGTIIEGSKLYLLLLIFVICTPISLVLTRSTLIFLRTPSVVFFLYSISILILAALPTQLTRLSNPLCTNRQMYNLNSMIRVGVKGIKQLAFFGLLVNNSLYLGLALGLTIDQLVTMVYSLLSTQNKGIKSINRIRLLGILISVCGTALALFGSGFRDIYSIIMLIVLIGSCIGQNWVESQQILQMQSQEQNPIQQTQPPQQQKEIDNLVTLHMLACGPILVLGFIMQEGVEVVEHEPSVPTLTIMLLGCVTFAVARISGAVLAQGRGNKTLVVANMIALGLTIVFNLIERGLAPTGFVMLTLVGAVVVVLGQSCAMWGGAQLGI
eukprot:TRINITY_DN6801_c0_g1_i12.p1 TRINITY_DN6801_c0_g1~~TRINITY_DN6801_c0_g1_i12.p1  ORF type:complete len:402 (-),score=38.28 TRINITY_DN6801_c0_g1_i12:536-1741(-)